MQRVLTICLLALATSSSPVTAADGLAEPWRSAYSGTDATGPHVIGLWKFDADAATHDSGLSGLTGTLDGAVAVPTGRFGGGLESFPGWPILDKHHALVVGNHPSLSPVGAFTAEMWVQAKPELNSATLCYLLDKKYASHHDYQWLLGAAEKSGSRRMIVNLGFGTSSESFATEPLSFVPGHWHHVAFSYDGAGTVRFHRDGSSVGSVTRPGRYAIAGGRNALSIGDRLGSNYGGFPGYLDEVRICTGALEFSPASLQMTIDRTVWVRHEAAAPLQVTVRNLQSQPLEGATLSLGPVGLGAKSIDIPPLPPGETHTIPWTLDTRLRPDAYDIRARLTIPAEPPIVRDESIVLQVVPRRLPHVMPVLMWGISSPTEFSRELPRLQELGFNHCLGFGADLGAIWQAKSPVVADSGSGRDAVRAVQNMLDTALANDFGIAAQLYPGSFLKQRPELARVDRQGQPYARHDANASLPGLQEFSENVGRSVALTHGSHPAFVAALVNSEVRDDSEISFSEFDQAAYRHFSGRDIPAEVTTKRGVVWSGLADFPADRVIPDDHPILTFYRWFWTVGDGWNGLHTALHRGLKSTGRDDLWTWYDPAIRVPSIGGSGGEVDVLSQWTYTEPSPLRVGYFADEVFAMAAAAGRQQRVMKMTQLFWYRSSSAPLKQGQDFIASPFDDHDPDAAYISISPVHLREAFWSMLARPVEGVMYHGWSSLVPTDGTHAYKYTQPDLQTEFRRLHHEVLPALGPTLLQVPDRPTDVAYLNSFTSQVFARRGSYGYAHDEAYLTLQHAQLQPEVLFEESLLRDGLDRYRILVLVDCDVLTSPVADAIRDFQQRGGLVIGDPNLAPAIQADVVLPRFTRTRRTAEDKATILAHAAQLRAALEAHAPQYARYADCTNPEIVTRVRSATATGASDTSDYVFVINDHREFGNYVGQHGLVMERGLPSSGNLRLLRPKAFVYDLVHQQPVTTQQEAAATSWRVDLGPGDGGLYLATPRPIEQVAIDVPARVRRGDSLSLSVTIADAAGTRVPAVIPVALQMTDSNGRVAEYSGHYGAADGTLTVTLDVAANDAPGVWTISAEEGATGIRTVKYVTVE